MSRSKHGSKSPGYDYWGPRPNSFWGGHSPFIKDRTHRKERRKSKEDLNHERFDSLRRKESF